MGEGLEGQEVGGTVVSISIAKPKREAGGAGGGGGGGRRDEVGCKLFVANLSEETSTDTMYEAFGGHGTVTDAFNTGRGFGFITYSAPAEASKAIAAMEGADVDGRTIKLNIAKPKESGGGGNRGRGGRGGGRGGGGRGGARGGRGGMRIDAAGGGSNKKMSFD